MFNKLKKIFTDWLFEKRTIKIGDLHNNFNKPEKCKIFNDNELKFIEQNKFYNTYVESENNTFIKIKKSLKTIEYDKWNVKINNNSLICADNHILMDDSNNEVFVKNIDLNKTKIKTKTGVYSVDSISSSNLKDNMYDLELSNNSSHTYYTNNILSHNTTTSSAFMLYFAMFSKDKRIAIVANKQQTAMEILSRIKLMYDHLPMWLKPGIEEWNKGSIAFDNGCKIIAAATSSSSIRGLSISLLYLDEFAFVQKNMVNEFIEATFPVISSSVLARIIITSTPNGKNHFYRFFEEARTGKSNFYPSRIKWNDIPGRDEKWREERIKELGSVEKFNQEYGAIFASDSNMAFNSETLSHIEKVHIQDFLTEGVQRAEGLRIYERPVKGRKYLIIGDTGEGKGKDSSTLIVIDITTDEYELVATYQNNNIRTHEYPHLIYKIALYYMNAFICMENNGVADGVLNDLYFNFEYENVFSADFTKENKVKKKAYHELGIRTNKKNKRIGVDYLRYMLDNYKIRIPDIRVVDELYTFVKNENDTYSASSGNHDDFVMNLVLFAYLVKTRESFEQLRNSYADYDDQYSHMDNFVYIEGNKIYKNDKDTIAEQEDEKLMRLLMADTSTDFEEKNKNNRLSDIDLSLTIPLEPVIQ